MQEIELTQGARALVDDEDFALLTKFAWHLSTKGYACAHLQGNSKLRMHRVVTNAPAGFEVDHIDGNKINNQKSNLRIVTTAQNQWNRVMRNKVTGFIGVSFDPRSPNAYVARISHNDKIKHIGRYYNPIEAALAYDKVAFELRSDFAILNFDRPA